MRKPQALARGGRVNPQQSRRRPSTLRHEGDDHVEEGDEEHQEEQLGQRQQSPEQLDPAHGQDVAGPWAPGTASTPLSAFSHQGGPLLLCRHATTVARADTATQGVHSHEGVELPPPWDGSTPQ